MAGTRNSTTSRARLRRLVELDERPDYFLQEVLQDQQMNYQQLAAYIRELQRSGIDTITLQVSFYRKFALPLFALVMALISVPFAFLAGNRGAMAGVGVSFTIAIAYWTIGKLFEQLGDVNLLPAALAAWSPDRDLRHGRRSTSSRACARNDSVAGRFAPT